MSSYRLNLDPGDDWSSIERAGLREKGPCWNKDGTFAGVLLGPTADGPRLGIKMVARRCSSLGVGFCPRSTRARHGVVRTKPRELSAPLEGVALEKKTSAPQSSEARNVLRRNPLPHVVRDLAERSKAIARASAGYAHGGSRCGAGAEGSRSHHGSHQVACCRTSCLRAERAIEIGVDNKSKSTPHAPSARRRFR